MNNITKNDFKMLYHKLKKIKDLNKEINYIKKYNKSNNPLINNMIEEL